MSTPPCTCIVAFDRHGIYCGSAELETEGRWRCWVSGMQDFHCVDTEQAAANWLRFGGAATISYEDGRKE